MHIPKNLQFFILILLFLSCKKMDSPGTTQTPTTPKLAITNFNPKAAMVGETVMITGTAFGTDSNVVQIKFGSSSGVKPKTITTTEMTVIVPADADTGNIQVTVNSTTVTSAETFILTKIPPPILAISSFSPATAQVGEEVTITGTAFGTDTNFVSITFGSSAPIKPTSVTPTTLKVKVPANAGTGKISVAVNGGTAVMSTNIFTLRIILNITDFSPKTVSLGDTMTIKGTLFGSSVDSVLVYFDPSYSTRPIQVTPTQIKVIVPIVGQTGKLRVFVYGQGNAYSETDYTFIETMSIWQLDPTSARPGEIISVHGNAAIGASINDITINFNGSASWVHPISIIFGTEMKVRVPLDATTGKVKASQTGYKSGISDSIFTVLPQMPVPRSGEWTRRSDFGTSGRAGAIAFTINDKAYIGCGETNAPFDAVGSSDIWEYDPEYNGWMQKASFSGGNRINAVAFSVGSKGYVGTGLTSDYKPTNDFWEYDPIANSWVQKADFKGDKRAFAVGFSISNKGYIGSGYNGNNGNTLSDFYEYNPLTNSWSQTSPIPGTRREAFAFVIDDKAYVGNGHYTDASDRKTRLSDLQMFDPSTNAWTAKASIPAYSYSSGNSSFSLTGKGIVGLGYDPLSSFSAYGTNRVFEYTPSSNSWKSLPNFSTVRSSAVGFTIGNVGYFGMGEPVGSNGSYRDFWAYKY